MSAASRLPEELLREILSYLLTTDEETFCRFGVQRLGGHWYRMLVTHYPASKINPLLVSKQWLRIGTPILYEKVLVFEASRTKTVAQLVKANPAVGRAIRYLRLEGGMGRDLLTIVKHAPNIHTMWISLNVRSSDSIAGLKKAVALLQPRKLYIPFTDHDTNKISAELGKLATLAISNVWTSLVSVTFYRIARLGLELSRALRDAPALQQIYMGMHWDFRYLLEQDGLAIIVKSKTLESWTFVRAFRSRHCPGEAELKEAAKARGLSDCEVDLLKSIDVPQGSVWCSKQDRLFSDFVIESDETASDDSEEE